MKTILSENHPYWHTRELALSTINVKHFTLSYYKYLPQSLEDNRKLINIKTEDFVEPKRVENLLNTIPQGMEIAFHSLIHFTDGATAHLPMVDMSTPSTVQLNKLAPFIGIELYKNMAWYKSGRSYHGYGNSIISEREWVILMGKLLLANKPGVPATVDTRWVGHRLIAGYSALRWSKNTDHYLHPPVSAKLLV